MLSHKCTKHVFMQFSKPSMMSTSNTKPTHQVLILATFITFFLFGLINKVKSVNDISFHYDCKFDPKGSDLIFDGDASVSSTGVLQLNKVVNGVASVDSFGRARYIAPVKLWDRSTQRVASFVTTFRFVMRASDKDNVAQGMTFFIAPPDSPLGQGYGYLGLFRDDKYDPTYQIVAVEFDTRYGVEAWDPNYAHIGVDVNSIKSKKVVEWENRYGEEAIVEIRYHASTQTLIATLTYPSDQRSYTVTTSVDMKAIIPEWVRVGFTGASGDPRVETHEVLDWSFTSTYGSKCGVQEGAYYSA